MTVEQRRIAPAAPPTTEASLEHLNPDGTTALDGNNHDNNEHSMYHLTIRRFGHVLSLMASPVLDDTGDMKSVAAGMSSLVVVGSILGLVTPKNHALPTPLYRNISAAIGYVYFLAWSVSFYPQVVSNFKRQSTVGLSPDFCVLNVLGFACYTAYNVSFFWSVTIREEYRKRHGRDAEITVQSNDVAFAMHALILSSVTVLQIMYYGNGMQSLRMSKPILLVFVGILCLCAVHAGLVVFFGGNQDSNGTFNWLNYLYMLSFVKIGISLIKYIPQVILNFQRRSTVGWSIWNILLDFTGGCLSIMQLVLDCAEMNDFSGITGNPAKFGLGFVSIFFDLIFMVQHYCLFTNESGRRSVGIHDEQQEPLLPPSTVAEEDEVDEGEVPTYQPETVTV
jgi:cystinosin